MQERLDFLGGEFLFEEQLAGDAERLDHRRVVQLPAITGNHGAGDPDLAGWAGFGLAMDAAKQLGDQVRVVSMPSTTVFDRQDPAYRESVLPKACRKRVAIEAGVTDFWRKYVGLDGAVIGIDEFGASAPAEQLFPYFGFTVEKVVEAARSL